MSDSKKTGKLKSAWELAMERMDAKDGQLKKLTEDQKSKIAEIEQTAKAKIAEHEIMFKERLFKAGGDHIATDQILKEKAVALQKIRDKAEQEKEHVRSK
ncbi:MAG: hypothetical protein GX811_11640 [Lentisphaerae bacterium]|nr:hypothetical protein [Lentisphaerota bacterium]